MLCPPLSTQADRAFCETILSNFAIEVGRQLGDMEQTQSTIRGDLQTAVVRLMESASSAATESARASNPPSGGGGGAAGRPGTPASELNIPVPPRPSDTGGAPFTVEALHYSPSRGRHDVRHRPSSAGRSHDGLPPMGKGVLPTTVFMTGDGAAPPSDPRRYAFQAHRPTGPLTPGEQNLVQHQLQRKRPQSSAGRLGTQRTAPGALSGAPPGVSASASTGLIHVATPASTLRA